MDLGEESRLTEGVFCINIFMNMESLERLFENFVSKQGSIEADDISEIIKKNLVPYFIRKGFSLYDAVSKSYTLMAYLINRYRDAFSEKDLKTIIKKIKKIRMNFAEADVPVIKPLDYSYSNSFSLNRMTADSIKSESPEYSKKVQGIPLFFNDKIFGILAIEDEGEKDISDSEILLYISQTLDKIDKNMSDAEEALMSIEKKLGEIEIDGSHTGNP